MKSFNSNTGCVPFTLYKETVVNLTFYEGQAISFFSDLFNRSLSGKLLKKYTNSCLVDISSCDTLTDSNKEKYNQRIIVSYKKIFDV